MVSVKSQEKYQGNVIINYVILLSFITENDPCLPNPCQNEGGCVALIHGAYKCTCPVAFVGTLCAGMEKY